MACCELGKPVRTKWLSWLLGLGLLAAVIIGALQASDHEAFVKVAGRAEPRWLLLAVLLQLATYPAQGEIWRRVGHAAGFAFPLVRALELSVAKVFADQALPSAGISSSVLVATSLQRQPVARSAINAVVLTNFTSYHLAYGVALLPALAIVARQGRANAIVIVMTALFLLFSIGISAAVMTLAGHRGALRPRAVFARPILAKAVRFVAASDPRLMRSPRLLAETVALQLAIVMLDAATMWLLIRALGTVPRVAGVFASFMIASLFRTMGIVPGGLGTFEATSVRTLRIAGVQVTTGLAATLLFRGLSFWLPMLPGYWFSRRAIGGRQRS
jgi:uncharacterized protein (TIRG00374 family)